MFVRRLATSEATRRFRLGVTRRIAFVVLSAIDDSTIASLRYSYPRAVARVEEPLDHGQPRSHCQQVDRPLERTPQARINPAEMTTTRSGTAAEADVAAQAQDLRLRARCRRREGPPRPRT